jgi:hypothetical protein
MGKRYKKGDKVIITNPKRKEEKEFLNKVGKLTRIVGESGDITLWEIEFPDREVRNFEDDEFELAELKLQRDEVSGMWVLKFGTEVINFNNVEEIVEEGTNPKIVVFRLLRSTNLTEKEKEMLRKWNAKLRDC